MAFYIFEHFYSGTRLPDGRRLFTARVESGLNDYREDAHHFILPVSTYLWQIFDLEAWKQSRTFGKGSENVLHEPSEKSKGKSSFLLSLQSSILAT